VDQSKSHSIGARAERKVEKELIDDLKRVSGKWFAFFPSPKDFGQADELVKDVVYPVVSKPTLQALVKEFKATGPTYREKVYTQCGLPTSTTTAGWY